MRRKSAWLRCYQCGGPVLPDESCPACAAKTEMPPLVSEAKRWDVDAKEAALRDATVRFYAQPDFEPTQSFMAAWWLAQHLLSSAEVIRA